MRLRAVVLEHVVGGGAGGPQHRPAQPRQHPADRRRRIVRKLVEHRLALLGNDQRMAVRQRADVQEREDVLVLVHLPGRDVPREDLVEDRGLMVAHGAYCGASLPPCPFQNAPQAGTKPTAASSSIPATSSCPTAKS